MNEKNVVLLIYEISLLLDIEYLNPQLDCQIVYNFDESVITDYFVSQLNSFIEKLYIEKDQELSILFDVELLGQFIDKGYETLQPKLLVQIVSKYKGMKKYLELVDSVGKENGETINNLALKFINFYNELLELYNKEEKGMLRILTQ